MSFASFSSEKTLSNFHNCNSFHNLNVLSRFEQFRSSQSAIKSSNISLIPEETMGRNIETMGIEIEILKGDVQAGESVHKHTEQFKVTEQRKSDREIERERPHLRYL